MCCHVLVCGSLSTGNAEVCQLYQDEQQKNCLTGISRKTAIKKPPTVLILFVRFAGSKGGECFSGSAEHKPAGISKERVRKALRRFYRQLLWSTTSSNRSPFIAARGCFHCHQRGRARRRRESTSVITEGIFENPLLV